MPTDDRRSMRTRHLAAGALAAVLLTACGGGDGGTARAAKKGPQVAAGRRRRRSTRPARCTSTGSGDLQRPNAMSIDLRPAGRRRERHHRRWAARRSSSISTGGKLYVQALGGVLSTSAGTLPRRVTPCLVHAADDQLLMPRAAALTAAGQSDPMEYRTLGRSGMRGVDPRARHDDLRHRDRRGRLARPAGPVPRGRRQPGRHRRRLQRAAPARRSSAAGSPSACRGPRAGSSWPPRAASRWGTGPNDLGLSRRHLRPALDASLRRLGVGLDRPLPGARATTRSRRSRRRCGFLDDAVPAGKIHYVGLSNFTGWQLQRRSTSPSAAG